MNPTIEMRNFGRCLKSLPPNCDCDSLAIRTSTSSRVLRPPPGMGEAPLLQGGSPTPASWLAGETMPPNSRCPTHPDTLTSHRSLQANAIEFCLNTKASLGDTGDVMTSHGSDVITLHMHSTCRRRVPGGSKGHLANSHVEPDNLNLQ